MRIAFDSGGTFTDCVFVRQGRLEILKVASTPRNPADAIAEALRQVLSIVGDQRLVDLVCGTTVGTNALLERRGGRVALVTTAGFEDVLEIGRQARPRLYDFFVERPAPLVPRERRFGLRERVDAGGRVVRRPSRSELARVVRLVKRSRATTVAVSFLFSFVHTAHERALARALRRAGFEVSVSHEILPEFREFERTSTTVVNAYLVPVMGRYLAEIQRRARSVAAKRTAIRVHVMQSNGGIAPAEIAAREPVRTVLSGPAGGVLGAQYASERSGLRRIISFDMGGTSTDVSLVDGQPQATNEAAVAEVPIAVPVLDIHTVGAGGGSLARFDRAGALRVGPESAGADPGPICYGRGERPTVTDAHVLLGRIPAGGLLGGEFALDEVRAGEWFRRAKGPLKTTEEFAQGIVDVANASMEKAIRVISIERGHDPRDYTLVAFGGAGPLHACELAAGLSIPRVLVPKFPGALSALGILRADVVRDYSQTVRLTVSSLASTRRALEKTFAPLERAGSAALRREGFVRAQIRSERLLDLRYLGQAYELTVRASGDFVRAFHRLHEQRYGYFDAQRPVEAVNARARLIGFTPKPADRKHPLVRASSASARSGVQVVYWRGQRHRLPVYRRERMRAGMKFAGPSIVTEYSATTFVPPGWAGRVDAAENLLLDKVRG
jgi:N-methylhydantoinase A